MDVDTAPDGEPFRVLVVCTANVARSPLAAAMLGAALPAAGVEVASAGVRAVDGQPAAREAVRLAADRSLDLSSHRARAVSHTALVGADLVLTMSTQQRDHCASRVPGIATRTFGVREFVRLLDAVASPAATPGATDPLPMRLRWLRDRANAARPLQVPPRGTEDVDDPVGGPPEAWTTLGDDLDELVGRIRHAVGAIA